MTAAKALALADRAEAATGVLPPLLVEAQRIAASVILGDHGRRRAGPGESFWQYRPYSFGDSTQRIDWHKSARAGRVFIRENEWEAANTLWVWSAHDAGMDFRSGEKLPTKRQRADLIAMAMAVLANRAHERTAALGGPFNPDHSRTSLMRIAGWLSDRPAAETPANQRTRFATALLAGDFFNPLPDTVTRVSQLAEAGLHGHLVQVVDPAEELFPYDGRVEFQEMSGPLKFTAARAETLRAAYGEKLEAHRDALRDLARKIGWTFTIHRTDQPLAPLLMSLHNLIAGDHRR